MEDIENLERELTKYLVITQQKLEALNEFYNPMIEKWNKGEMATLTYNPKYFREYDSAIREWEEASKTYRELLEKYLRLKSIEYNPYNC